MAISEELIYQAIIQISGIGGIEMNRHELPEDVVFLAKEYDETQRFLLTVEFTVLELDHLLKRSLPIAASAYSSN